MESLYHTPYVQDKQTISMHKQRLNAVLLYQTTINTHTHMYIYIYIYIYINYQRSIHTVTTTNTYCHNKVNKLGNYNFRISTSIDPILSRYEK